MGRKSVLIGVLLLSGAVLASQVAAVGEVAAGDRVVYFYAAIGLGGLLCLLALWFGFSLFQRRQMVEILRRSQGTLNSILQGIDDPIVMVDKDLNLLWANDQAKMQFGEHMVGRKCYEAIQKRTQPCDPYPCMTLMAFRDGEARQWERRVTAPNGETRYYLCSSKVALRDNGGRPKAVVEISRDITAFREAQEDLHLAKWANDSSINPIGMTDLQGRLTYVNQACLDLWGYSSEKEVLGKELVDFLQNPLDALKLIDELKKSGGWRGSLMAKKRDGSEFDVEAQAYLTRNSQGEPICLTGYFFDVTEKKRTEREIRQLAYYDTLTGLPNRTLLADHMEMAIGHARRGGESVAILLLDLDNFKQVNDSMGHAKGDQILQEVAARLTTRARKGDTLARWAGDEFVFILTNMSCEASAATFARKVLDLLTEQPFTLDDREIFATASVGIAIFPQDGEDVATLLQHADTAMYEAKGTGGNSHHFFSERLHQKIVERHKMEGSLRRALREEEFHLVYQPQIDLISGKVVGVEALVRWQHPEKGLVLPGEFIPVAEQTGLIRPLGAWILRAACKQAAEWQRAGDPPWRIAVNLSARQFQQPHLVDQIERILQETGLEPRLLELELTESVFMENLESAVEVLVDLKTRGIQIAIDDFGTGYSSLSYLKNFPIDRIKIAQEFVRDVLTDPNDMAIVEATIAMARSLGLKVIAEGVESKEQMMFLKGLGCVEMQGFYFAVPMPADQVAALIGKEMVQASLGQPELSNPPRKKLFCTIG
jgi:diguanylate cyclase (GGDEF)-like protein/PAS domain S-box-containing protein